MAYVLPTFNLVVNIWHPVVVIPPPGVPNIVTVGNLTPGRRWQWGSAFGMGRMYLLLPPLTDVRVGGVAEVPGGSTRWYKVFWVDDIGKGFANEHRYAILDADVANWPIPYP